MSRWVWRAIAALILVVFLFMMMHLQRRLIELRRAHPGTTSTR